MDEKTSIQARQRRHEEMPPEPKQSRRIESEYGRKGALQYLAAWDVHRGIVLGWADENRRFLEPPEKMTETPEIRPNVSFFRLALRVVSG
jgi:hypothetical protein